MSLIATAVKHLLAAGVTGDALVAAIADMEAAQPKDAAAEKRRAWDRERKRKAATSTGIPPESAESAETPSPLGPPLKVSPDPFKITPPISPQPTTDRRACRLPNDWKPAPLTGKALAMVARWGDGQLERELAKFKNHWLAKPGKDACKTDWQRTFINWLISADERKPNGNLRHTPPASRNTAAVEYSLRGLDPHATF